MSRAFFLKSSAFIAGGLIGLGVMEIAAWSGRREVRREAVRLGHAEYRADKDGNVVWAWREAK
jgi:hypothetical protein